MSACRTATFGRTSTATLGFAGSSVADVHPPVNVTSKYEHALRISHLL